MKLSACEIIWYEMVFEQLTRQNMEERSHNTASGTPTICKEG